MAKEFKSFKDEMNKGSGKAEKRFWAMLKNFQAVVIVGGLSALVKVLYLDTIIQDKSSQEWKAHLASQLAAHTNSAQDGAKDLNAEKAEINRGLRSAVNEIAFLKGKASSSSGAVFASE